MFEIRHENSSPSPIEALATYGDQLAIIKEILPGLLGVGQATAVMLLARKADLPGSAKATVRRPLALLNILSIKPNGVNAPSECMIPIPPPGPSAHLPTSQAA